MNIALITGITGMVGSHLAEFLYKNTNWQIVGLIRWRSSLENLGELIEQIEKSERITLKFGDLRDASSLNKLIKEAKPTHVFHLAAQSYPQTSFIAPADTLETNIIGTQHLLDAIRNYAPSALVHVCSSSEIFGRVPPEMIPIKEDCTLHPASPYAISKVGTDLLARFYAEAYQLKIIVTRMFTHTGPRRGDIFAESSFAKQIALIETGKISPIIKTGNLNSLRTFADVRDAVKAYYMALTINPIPGESYNIGGNHTCTVGEMLNHLINLSNKSKEIKIETDPIRLRPIDADLQVPDTRKFEKHTGWKPTISFEQTMLDLLNYWRHRVAQTDYTFLSR